MSVNSGGDVGTRRCLGTASTTATASIASTASTTATSTATETETEAGSVMAAVHGGGTSDTGGVAAPAAAAARARQTRSQQHARPPRVPPLGARCGMWAVAAALCHGAERGRGPWLLVVQVGDLAVALPAPAPSPATTRTRGARRQWRRAVRRRQRSDSRTEARIPMTTLLRRGACERPPRFARAAARRGVSVERVAAAAAGAGAGAGAGRRRMRRLHRTCLRRPRGSCVASG